MSRSANSVLVERLTGASYRQLDYWVRCGYISDDLVGKGSGGRREWRASHIETAHALLQSSSLGGSGRHANAGAEDYARLVAQAVRARLVNPEGEWLVITADGTAQRFDKLLLDDLTHFEAARVIRLRSFADVFAGAA